MKANHKQAGLTEQRVEIRRAKRERERERKKKMMKKKRKT